MHVDMMTGPKPLQQMGGLANAAKAAGFDGMLLTEGSRTSFPAITFAWA